MKHLVIITMFFVFLLSACTGLIKFPETQKYFLFTYNYISASNLSTIHDWSGIILILLIIIHLILKKEGIKKAFTNDYQISKKTIYIIIGIIIISIAAIYIKINYLNTKNPINLTAVEVRDYNGEKLDSIDDFRENSIKGVQIINKDSYKLDIAGLTEKSAQYSYSDVLKLQLYQKVVQLNCVEGWDAKILWEGILVKDLLKDPDIKPEAKTIIFYAQDGYSTSFPLDYIMDNDILMAYKMNGVEIPPERGFPFQLVAEQKWGYKWIKWITKIEISDNTDYKGFWESRGYNNIGNLNESKFENQ
jgi:hypothetical protein